MYHLTRHAVVTSAVLVCILVLTVGAPAARGQSGAAQPVPVLVDVTGDSSSDTTAVLSEDVTSDSSINTKVTNAVMVSTEDISLGSSLDAQGTATIGQQPLANAGVALHMGDVVVATTQTNAAGDYAFSVPVGVHYFLAAVSGTPAIYTVATSPDGTSADVPSGVTHVAVDTHPFYTLLIVVVGVVLVGTHLYAWRRGKAARPADAKSAPPDEEPPSAEDAAYPPAPLSASAPDELHKYGIVVPIGHLSQPGVPPKHEKSAEAKSPLNESAPSSDERAEV